MFSGDLRTRRLLDVLLSVQFTLSDGCVRVRSEGVRGSIFFEKGRFYFGIVGDDQPTTREAIQAGITAATWRAALSEADASGRVTEKLVANGSSIEAVRSFLLRRLARTLKQLLPLTDGSFAMAAAQHPFGAAVSFSLDEITAAIGSPDDDRASETLMVFRRVAQPTVLLSGDEWNAVVRLLPTLSFDEFRTALGHDRGTSLATALQPRGLMTEIVPKTDPTPSEEASPPEARDGEGPSLFVEPADSDPHAMLARPQADPDLSAPPGQSQPLVAVAHAPMLGQTGPVGSVLPPSRPRHTLADQRVTSDSIRRLIAAVQSL